mgnify:CR=1 FL=1
MNSKRGLTSIAFKIPVKTELCYKDEEIKTYDDDINNIKTTKKNESQKYKTFLEIDLSKIKLTNEVKSYTDNLKIMSC